MIRRIALVFSAFAVVSALAWGLFQLHGIFVEERDGALVELAARRRALEQFAHKELEQRLRDQLAETRPTIDAAAADPLIPATTMWLVDRGEQLLPRTSRGLAGTDASATTLFQLLTGQATGLALERAQAEDPEGPWTTRVALLVELNNALGAGDRGAIEEQVRRILSHRASFVIAVTRDVPYTLAVLSILQRQARPARSLMEALLRDGLDGQSARLEGLQRVLLRSRERFTEVDLKFLAARIVELCEAHNVLYADFSARVAEPPGEVLALPPELAAPSLVHDGRWYVEPMRNQRTYGIGVNVPAVLDEITSAMRERALLESEDEVKQRPAASEVAVSDLVLEIASPRWGPAIEAVHGRYRLKALLEVVIAALVFGVMGLGGWIYRRRHRFLELKSDFVSAVSHELRTPLASIRLMAETLERRLGDDSRARDYPTRIIRDVDALSFLVENILSFNRLSRGRWVPKIETLKLGRIVDKLDGARDIWARRPAELSARGLDEVELRADADLLQLLLTNLARNACQYNERTPVVIEMSADRRGAEWHVRVRDNGVGIPEGERERIFDDFYRAGSGSGERGSGLGLAICRKIMEAHQGSIAVAETSSEGTVFELRFPIAG